MTTSSCASGPRFPQFSKLPPEIRLEIWKLALPDTRVFRIRSPMQSHMAPILMEYNHRPPSALKTCHESRQVASKEGKFLFGPRSSSSTGGLWFNPAKDILFFPSHPKEWEDKDQYYESFEVLKSLRSNEIWIDHVRNVAVDRHAGNNWYELARILGQFMEQCTTLFITMDHSTPGSGRNVTPYFMKDDDHLSPIEGNGAEVTSADDGWYYFDLDCTPPCTCDVLTNYIKYWYQERGNVLINEVRGLELFEIKLPEEKQS
ncbi:hypothetical protein CC79DRAFT_358638 [Sarocladium strictum]